VERISDRHEGDLDGQLESFESVRPMAVAVIVAPETAHVAATQHTAWMTVNPVARAAGVIESVRVICHDETPIAGRIVPLAPRHLSLHDALIHGGQAIGGADVTSAPSSESCDVTVVVGASSAHKGWSAAGLGDDGPPAARRIRYALGDGWWGDVSDAPFTNGVTSVLPYGPYVAAALVVAEVFLDARLPAHVPRLPSLVNTLVGWFGTKRSWVRIPPPRLWSFRRRCRRSVEASTAPW
jgi:hypothetical protein